MKHLRILLVAFASMLCLGAQAQFTNYSGGKQKNNGINSSDISVSYHGDFGVGIFAGDATLLTFGTTQGVKISDYFFAGVGVWAEMFTENTEYWNIAPLLSLKGYLPLSENLRIFLNPEFGASIGVAGDWNDGSSFEYRLSTGFEYQNFFLGVGCGGAGSTSFFAKIGYAF